MNETSYDLEKLARKVMKEKGLEPDFPPEVLKEAEQITLPEIDSDLLDLRKLPWCSIDNNDSQDLDQLSFAELDSEGHCRLLIAIADLASVIPKNSAIDKHAQINTTSVYTPAKVFPMIPEKLSNDLTSLKENHDRQSIVLEIILNTQGKIISSSVQLALVRNFAKLNYFTVGAWLSNPQKSFKELDEISGLKESLLLQYEASQTLRKIKNEPHPISEGSEPIIIAEKSKIIVNFPEDNPAQEMIEIFMITCNGIIADHFQNENIANLRRVVKIPKRWDRIVEIAKQLGEELPIEPDAKSLDLFLLKQRKSNPDSFPELSLTIIKLLGSGEYVVELPWEAPIGHFGLSIARYTHFTAPNRRYPDLVTQRQLKANRKGEKSPYEVEELSRLAAWCTKQEDAANKVERQMNKSAAALKLSTSIGNTYSALVTGASQKGTWVRLHELPIEGRVIQGYEGLDVGEFVKVKLVSVSVSKGFIDFVAI